MRIILLIFVCTASLLLSALVRSADADLPVTDQVTCYDENGTTVSCDGTGQDGDHQTGVAWPNPRFVIGTGNEVDCITDRLTGLMWLREPISAAFVSWETVIDDANQATDCGHNDWRVPNVVELESLLNYEQQTSGWLAAQGFITVLGNEYWTSTSYAPDPQKAWLVDFVDNGIHSGNKTGAIYSVLHVRGGE